MPIIMKEKGNITPPSKKAVSSETLPAETRAQKIERLSTEIRSLQREEVREKTEQAYENSISDAAKVFKVEAQDLDNTYSHRKGELVKAFNETKSIKGITHAANVICGSLGGGSASAVLLGQMLHTPGTADGGGFLTFVGSIFGLSAFFTWGLISVPGYKTRKVIERSVREQVNTQKRLPHYRAL